MVEVVPCIATDGTSIWVFKGGQKISQESLWPENIIIGEDCDGGLDSLEALHHLKTLVCSLRTKDLDVEKVKALAQLLKTAYILLRCDDDDRAGVASCNGQDTAAEFIIVPKRWNDYCHIFRREGWWKPRTNRLVSPSREGIDDCPRVSPEPARARRLAC